MVGVWLCCQEWYVDVVCLVGEKVVGNMLLIWCSGWGWWGEWAKKGKICKIRNTRS